MSENIFNLPSGKVQNETKDVLQQIANTLGTSIDTVSRMDNVEELVSSVIDGEIQGVLNHELVATDIANKLNAKETEYAPKLTEVTTQLAQTGSLVSGDINNIVNFPTQPSIHSYFSGRDAFKQSDATLFAEYLNLFSDLQASHPEYITKVSHGTDSSGWRKLDTYIFEPANPQKTIILMSGVHGGEKLAIISMYKLLKLIAESWTIYPELAFLRKHVRLVVIPIANPSGVYFNNRNTANGVDINRNYDYKHGESTSSAKGEVPFSEKETQVIRDVVAQYPEAQAFIDCHNMGEGDRDYPYVYYAPQVRPFPHEEVQEVTTHITGVKSIDVSLSDNPNSMNYFESQYGMISFTPEYVPGSGLSAYGSEDMTRALNWFGNIVLQVANMSSKNVRLTSKNASPEPHLTYKRFFSQNPSNFIPVASSYTKIEGTEMERSIPTDGYIRFTATISAQAYNETKPILYVTPHIVQTESTSVWRPGQPFGTMRSYFEQSQTIDNRGNLVVEATIPVWESYGILQIELRAWATEGGDVRIRQMSQSLEFVPTQNHTTGVLTAK